VCHVWRSPPPFDHLKLMTIDGGWSLIGSANWDMRSLRLNFELTVEFYDTDLATQLAEIIDARCLHDHVRRNRQASVHGEASGHGGAAVDALYLKADRMRFP
jgi:phosphatidylserine/phosphatidylglycerophosphate/cardiolipin synthase-like enzyme